MTADPLGAILLTAAPLGVAGVFALALGERLIPFLPSSGLFTAIGVAAAEGLWCVSFAVVASVLGSGTGALSAFRVGAATAGSGGARLRLLLRRRDRWGRRLRIARRTAASFPFIAQLVPATRIIAPLIGGAVRPDRRRFLFGTIAGLTLWNVTFIVTGFAAARLGATTNATVISLGIFVAAASVTVLVKLWGSAGRTVAGRTVGFPALRSRAA